MQRVHWISTASLPMTGKSLKWCGERRAARCCLQWNEEKKGEGGWPLSRALRLSISSILKGGYGFPRKEKGNMMKKFYYFILLKENENLVKKHIFF